MDVWIYPPRSGGVIVHTTEEKACSLIASHEGYAQYIFFFAALTTEE